MIDSRPLNLRLSSLARAAQWQEALQLLRQVSGVRLDVVSFGTIIKAFSKALRWERSFHCLKLARSRT